MQSVTLLFNTGPHFRHIKLEIGLQVKDAHVQCISLFVTDSK